MNPEGNATQLQLPLLSDALSECEQLRAELNQLRKENAVLREENVRLHSGLQPSDIEVEPTDEISKPSSTVFSQNSKLNLFQTLFRARDDVYAERWQKKDGIANYSPAKLHDWDSHRRNDRGKWECAPSCRLLPLTEKVLAEHLNGHRTVGIYPLLKDETCWLLALDFDDADWSDDARAFLQTCDSCGVPAYLERSRSGNGAHVWIFFESAVPAFQARALGAFLLSETKQKRYALSFKSYDRMFPNQDTMPRGGYGNLIALPLQLEPSKCGNSVFVDGNLIPFANQWAFLASVVRMHPKDVDSIVRAASGKGRILTIPLSSNDSESDEPWLQTSGIKPDKILPAPHPDKVQIIVGNMLYVPKEGFGSAALSKLMGIAAFQNPEFYQKQAARQSTYDTPRIICCADDYENFLALPRGCRESVQEYMAESNVAISERDERFEGHSIPVMFNGELRPNQLAATAEILAHDSGILCASTAFGKTVVAAYVVAQRKVNTLVLVHTVALIDQWKERLQQFLELPQKSIGQIGGGKKNRTGCVDIATIQSLIRKGNVSDVVSEYGQIIVDECHHISAFSFEQVVKRAKAKYVLGLTATPARKDGHQPIITMQCGPIRFKESPRDRPLTGVRHAVIPRQTGFQLAPGLQEAHINELYEALAADETRNDLIFDDVLKELEQRRSPLVITERLEHLEALSARLRGFAKNVIVLKGGMSKRDRLAAFAKLREIPNDAERIILATGKYIGEGFDDARLDTLFLLLPISFEGRVEQYAGRLHRQHAGKTDIRIYDYVDSSHPILNKMFERRCKKYRKLGYEIMSGRTDLDHIQKPTRNAGVCI